MYESYARCIWFAGIEKVVVEPVLVRALRCIAQGGCILPLELTPLYSSSLQVLAFASLLGAICCLLILAMPGGVPPWQGHHFLHVCQEKLGARRGASLPS